MTPETSTAKAPQTPRPEQKILFLVLAFLASWRFNSASASPSDWVGSAKCGSCHPQQLASWQTTRHALTRDRFEAKPQGRCLACHGTGDAPAGKAIAVEVGCEACHGAGAAYATDDLMRNRTVAMSLGLVELSTQQARTALCMQCHTRATTSRTFDPTAPVHPVKAKAP